MPIYEFRCGDCQQQFETLVRNSSETVTCKHCSGTNLKKLISAHSVTKGSPDTACGTAPCSPAPACGSGGCCPGLN